jgi:transglutaminase-like putative cysteine protease
VHNDEYEDKIVATFNNMKIWDIVSSLTKNYNLGITSSVEVESYIASDLNGADALSIQEIKEKYTSFVRNYCQAQSNETTVYIDPNNSNIKNIASNLLKNAGTNNSFLVAMEIFKWLKQQTKYKIHLVYNNPQPAAITLEYKTGDCDDLTFLYISLCRSIGIPSRFIRGFLIEENNAVAHAWAEVFVGPNIGIDGWIPVECAGVSSNIETEIHQNFGLESVDHLRLFKDDGSNESLNISLSGLNYVTYGSRTIDANSFANLSNYIVLESKELIINEDGNRQYK